MLWLGRPQSSGSLPSPHSSSSSTRRSWQAPHPRRQHKRPQLRQHRKQQGTSRDCARRRGGWPSCMPDCCGVAAASAWRVSNKFHMAACCCHTAGKAAPSLLHSSQLWELQRCRLASAQGLRLLPITPRDSPPPHPSKPCTPWPCTLCPAAELDLLLNLLAVPACVRIDPALVPLTRLWCGELAQQYACCVLQSAGEFARAR